MFAAIVLTGNHYIVDGIAGGVVVLFDLSMGRAWRRRHAVALSQAPCRVDTAPIRSQPVRPTYPRRPVRRRLRQHRNVEVALPGLTSVDLPGEELGRTSTTMLLDQLLGDTPTAPDTLSTHLLKRESTAPLA